MNNQETGNNIFDQACYDSWDYIKNVSKPNNETKEFINYWLHGTETKPNFIDQACYDSLDYIKNVSNPSYETKEFINYWLHGSETKPNFMDQACIDGWDYIKDMYGNSPIINNEDACQELAVTCEAQVNYFSSGLCWLAIIYAILGFIYNFDIIKATYTCIDKCLYDIICMFDYPGFMVNQKSTMPLWGGFGLRVRHHWFKQVDPGDNNWGISHFAQYTLDHEYFFIDFVRYAPLWSRTDFIDLTIIPHLDWPFNYDHFHIINLWSA